MRSSQDTFDRLHVNVRNHAPGVAVGGNKMQQPTTIDHDSCAVEQTVEHSVGVTATHGDVEVDVPWLVHEVHGQRTADRLNTRLQRHALLLGKSLASNGREHLDDIAPGLGGHDDMAKLADFGQGGGHIRQVGRRGTGESTDVDWGTKVVAHVGTRQGHVLDVMVRQGGVATGTAGQEAVENVDQPKGATERLVLNELVGVTAILVNRDDSEHLGHTSCLAKVNVGPDSVPVAPLMNSQETKSLDVRQARVVQVLHDQVDRLGREMLSSASGSTLTAISADQGCRASIEHSQLC